MWEGILPPRRFAGPSPHNAPIFDVIRAEAVFIDDFTYAVIGDLMPQLGMPPTVLALQLLDCKCSPFLAICHQDRLFGDVQKPQTLQDLLLAATKIRKRNLCGSLGMVATKTHSWSGWGNRAWPGSGVTHQSRWRTYTCSRSEQHWESLPVSSRWTGWRAQ